MGVRRGENLVCYCFEEERKIYVEYRLLWWIGDNYGRVGSVGIELGVGELFRVRVFVGFKGGYCWNLEFFVLVFEVGGGRRRKG